MALNDNLKVDIVAQAALKAFNAAILPIFSFSTDFSADAVKKGDTIDFTWTPAGGTVRDFNGTYVTEEPTQLAKQLTIDTRKYVGFHYTDSQLAKLTMLKLNEIGEQYGAALATAVLGNIFTFATAANFANVIPAAILADNFDSDSIADIGKQCTNLKWPKIGRNMILNPDFYTALTKDPAVKGVDKSGSNEALMTGRVPALGTFSNIWESTEVPENGENLQGFAVNSEAIGIAFRVVVPGSSAAEKVMEYRTYTNSAGMTIAFKEWYDPNTETTKRILEVNYGKAVGNPDALVRIVDA